MGGGASLQRPTTPSLGLRRNGTDRARHPLSRGGREGCPGGGGRQLQRRSVGIWDTAHPEAPPDTPPRRRPSARGWGRGAFPRVPACAHRASRLAVDGVPPACAMGANEKGETETHTHTATEAAGRGAGGTALHAPPLPPRGTLRAPGLHTVRGAAPKGWDRTTGGGSEARGAQLAGAPERIPRRARRKLMTCHVAAEMEGGSSQPSGAVCMGAARGVSSSHHGHLSVVACRGAGRIGTARPFGGWACNAPFGGGLPKPPPNLRASWAPSSLTGEPPCAGSGIDRRAGALGGGRRCRACNPFRDLVGRGHRAGFSHHRVRRSAQRSIARAYFPNRQSGDLYCTCNTMTKYFHAHKAGPGHNSSNA